MPLFGNIIVIKRNGTDGIRFPLTASSCLFGRRTECDIRIQLPQVSKEHCKIEVNENKEAILTNLSTINPTQLNGDCFQHPVPLKHGDVLTIIDRSFRFEYPLQSTPRKKRSRSPRDETLQVLHVQQVAEVELLHKPTWGSKSLHASENAEWEEKNANDKKQSTEEKTCKALPVKPQTPKSAHRAHLSSRRQSEMSPFSKLYEKLKCEMKVPKTLQEGNVCHQAARGDGKSVLLEPSARTSLSCFYDLGSLPREKARSRSENIGECKIKGEATCSELNQISAVGSATRKTFTRSPRASVSKEIAGDPGERNHLQDLKEVSTEGSSKCTEITSKSSKEKDANAAVSLKPCIVECLDCADKITIHSCPAAVAKLAQRTNTANVSEVDEYVLSPPMSRRRSPGSHFIAPPRETSGMNPVYSDTPTTRGRESLKCQSFPEMLAGTPREDSACGNDSPKQLPLAGKECLKPRRNSKQCTPGRAVKEEVLTEICDQANFVKSEEERSETPVSLSNSRSPRRSNRPSKELSRTSVHLVTPTSGELTSELSPPGSPYCESVRQRDRPRASGLLTEKVLETSAVQENPSKTPNRNDKGGKEELATKGHHQQQDLEDACDTRPRRLSSRRSSGNAALPKGNEAVSEVDVSDVLTGVDSGKTKMLSQKRKSGGVSLQPLEKRKRVSFGGHLSPELFDKSLPPNSPIKRGAIPARLNLPFGDSPRAVLKKAQGLKRFAVQELAEHLQKETMSPKHLPAGKSPAASSPASGKARPTPPLGSPAPFTKNRFSVSRITTPSPIAEEKDAIAENVNMKEKRDPRVKTPKSSQVHPDDKTSSTNTPDKLTKTAQLASKVTPVRRSGAVAVISAKRRSGASSANLLVAKSWAEVVKLGVARPQSKTVKRSVRKGRSLKKKTTSPKTPERKIKGHFSTGHAESPATIVVGRAYSTTVTTVGQVPKVVKNPIVMLNMNMDESFTGIAEMFQTPENKSGKTLPLASVQKTEFTPTGTAVETSELQTPEESGEMMVSPLNSSDASEQRQDSPDLFHFQTEESVKFVFDTLPMKTPEEIKAMVGENVGVESLSLIPEKERSRLKAGRKRRTPKQKGEPLNALSGIRQLRMTPKRKLEPAEASLGIKELIMTPKRKPEPIEVLSGIKKLMKTPKQKPEPIEDLSGIKQLMKTPKQKPEPIEDLSGIKQLMKTPKQKPEPIEDLSGIKQLMKTPKQKPEPIEDLSGIKQLMKTPKQKPEPIEDLSGIKQLMKTPKQKPEPIEDLSGIKQLMKTPKQKPEPIEDLSGIKQLIKTPKQKPEPIDDLSGIKQLIKNPKQKPEPIDDLSGIKQLIKNPKQKPEPIDDLSGIKQLIKNPKQKPEPIDDLSGIKQLMKTPKQKPEPIDDLSGIKQLMKTPKQKPEPIEDLSGIKQLMKTPKQKPEPIEDLSGIKQLMKTPKQKPEPIEDLSGIKQLMKTPKQKPEPIEDLSGIKQLMKTPKQKPEPIEDLSGIKQLMKTPKQKPEPIEDLSGIKQLMKTPKQKPEPIEDLSGIKQLMKTPHQEMEPVTPGNRSQRLRDTPAQEGEAVKDVAGVTSARKIPKLKHQPAEAMVGVGRIFKTPKEKFEPIEDLFGISTLVKTRREKYPPVEDFVGLQRLMAEPKQKWSDFEEDCVGLAELFETPEEEKVTSGSVGDSEQEDPAPPCTNSSHKYEDKGNVSEGEDSQQKEAPSEDGSAQRPTKGRSRKTEVPPASAKQRENHLNAKELQSLGEKSTQEEMEEIGTSVAKSRGRGRRANRCIQEEMVSQHPHQEEVETDSFVGGHGAPQRGRRGKGKNPTELKHPSENLESCGKDSSVVRKQRTNRKQTLQECGINGILETEDDPTRSSSIQNENCHLQTGLKRSENNPEQGGVDDSEEMLLWPRRCGVKAAESREPPIPPQRAGRARNNPVKQGASEDLPRTRRQLRKGPSAKREGDNQNCKEDTKTATAEKSESGTKLERKTTENKVKFLRSARKASTEIKADICELALENVQNIPKPQETSTATGTETQSDVKNEIKGPQGDTVDSMSGIKVLKRTRKRKAEPLEAVSGIRQLMKNRQQELEPVTAGIGSQRLLETPAQEGEAVKDVAGVTSARKTPKLKHQPAEAMAGVRRIFKTPEGKVERRADGFGVGTSVKTRREKYPPVEDFVGLQRLMAEPKQNWSDFEEDCVGLAELFETPEEAKVTSGSVGDSEQEDPAPPCTNSSHKYEDKGNVSEGEDSQQKEAPSEDGSAQRPTKGRSRKKKVPSASAKQRENHLNAKELQSLGEKSTQEEMEEIGTSVAKSRGRGRRANRCIQEEMVSQHPHQEEVETDSFVGGHGAPQRGRRGKGKNPTELKHPSENLESCGKDSSVVRKQRTNRKQTLQECGINGILETEDDPTRSSSIQNENCHLQTGLKKPENNPEQGGVDDSEEMLHFLNKIPAAGSDSPALNHRQWAGNAQAVLKPKQTEIPQENLAQKNGTRCRRLRGRNVNFKLEEGSFKICGGNMVFPECEKGKTCKDGQRETPENPSLQVRRSRRRQVESIPQVPCVPSMENQTRIAGDSKDEASLKEQDSGLAATPSSTQENPLRRGKRREVAAASPTPRSPPVKRRGLPKGDDKKMSVREEENPSLGNKSLPAKTNASARGARKKIDLGGEVETGNIEERTNEEQNMSLETVSRAKEKPLGRGRRTGTALASHTTNPISLRGKRRLPADSGREEAPKEYRNVPLQTFDSPVKEDQLRRGRRIGIALVVEGTSSVLGNQGLSKESTRKKLILANHGTPEEQQNRLMAVAPLAKGNPSGVVRKKRIASRCEETTSPFLGKDPVLPRDKCQKRIKTQEVAPEQQATASSLRRKCQLPADDLASKKLRSECDENKSLQKGRRKKNQEQLVEEDVRAPQTTGGMDRKTRSSTRTSARTRK